MLDVLGDASRISPAADEPSRRAAAVHARYTRIEILAAFGVGDGAKVAPWQTGVYWAKEAQR